MKITITDQILSGNMGDGWADQNAAATAYADYLTDEYRAAVQAEFPAATIIVAIEASRNTSGCGRDLAISVDPWNDETAFEIENALTESLAHVGSQAWDSWCGGDGSEYFTE